MTRCPQLSFDSPGAATKLVDMKSIGVLISIVALAAITPALHARPADCGPPHRHMGADLYYLADARYIYASPCQAGWEHNDPDKRKPLRQNTVRKRKIYSPE
ncbi:MAG: hypothetical protein N2Z21_04625 [Candidatus Sumerlaeaceae bacterium]|nr:hypothetical protein [Candidatus Sumerlaeaceae bacterium]